MKKRILLPTLIIGTLLTSSLALAGPGYGRNCIGEDCIGGGYNSKARGAMTYEQHEERMEHRLEKMSTVLDLTETQQEQIKALFDKQYRDHQPLREQMQAARDAVREARTAETFNEADFRTKAAKQAELKIEMMVQREKMKQELYAILTPEQQEKAETLRGLMGGGKGQHGGKGMRF